MAFMIGGPSAPSIGDFSMPYDESTFTCEGHSTLTQGEKRYRLRKKHGEGFDNTEADSKFYQELRGSNVKYSLTHNKNPF
jgi:hypothetical protein